MLVSWVTLASHLTSLSFICLSYDSTCCHNSKQYEVETFVNKLLFIQRLKDIESSGSQGVVPSQKHQHHLGT